MTNFTVEFDAADNITVNYVDSGNKLTLTRETNRFVGYVSTDFICVTYLENCGDDCYSCVNSEYYLASEYEMATEAFFERLKNDPVNLSSLARDLSEFVKPE